MRRRVLWALVPFASLGALPGCPEKAVPPAVEAEMSAVEDAGAPPLPELRFGLDAVLVDGGVAPVPLESEGPALVDPATELRLRSTVRLQNYRVRVFDELDQAMVSDDRAAEGPEGLSYTIAFHQPLKPGHRYSLVVDAESGAAMLDPHGRNHADRRFELKVSGERERPTPKKRPGRKRRR